MHWFWILERPWLQVLLPTSLRLYIISENNIHQSSQFTEFVQRTVQETIHEHLGSFQGCE